MHRLLPPLWALAGGLGLAFLLLALSLPEPPHRLDYTRIENGLGIPLWVVVYSPQPPASPAAPAAVICQPFNDPPEYARLLALELVRDGFVVLVFDWRGRAPGENRQLQRAGAQEILRADLAAAVAYLRGLPEVDPARIVLAGHSVGGTLVIEAALSDPTIAAVASIGMEAQVTPEAPPNLLWATGLYDEFRGLNRMRETFRASAATLAGENTTVGEFARGTARRLGVSPTADHFTELQDPGIQREVRDWFRRAVGLRPQPRPLRMELRALLLLLAWLAGLVAVLAALRRLAGAHRWALRVFPVLALLGILWLSRVRGPGFLLATDGILWLLLATLLAGFIATRESRALARGLRVAGSLALLVWVSLFLTLVVNNLANYLHQPRYLLSLPEFALRHPLDALYAYLLVYSRPLLFSLYDPETIAPRLWVYAVVGLEILFPGLLLGLVARLARRPPGPARERRLLPGARGVLLLVLLGGLAAVVWLRLEQGFLTGESARAALRFLLRFAVLPLFLFALLWRWFRGRILAPGE